MKNNEYSILSKEVFSTFFKKYKHNEDIIKRKFSTGIDFEPNFMNYFPKTKLEASHFTIYPDKINEENTEFNRLKFIEKIRNSQIGKNYWYLGRSGIGKTTSILCALKYKLRKNEGSLYINLKTMRKFSENQNIFQIKQIFIDEIAFLFHDDYENYFSIANDIKSFEFKSEPPFVWELIEFILEKINEIPKNKFIIIFDEYKAKNDLVDKYSELCDKYLKDSKIFSFVKVSPICDKDYDIREALIKKIMGYEQSPFINFVNFFLDIFIDE